MFKRFLFGLLLSTMITACGSNPGEGGAAQVDQIQALEDRLTALETQITELQAEPAAIAFQVVIAQYIMGNAGFHTMDETLNETKTVDPAYLGTVTQVRKVVSQTPWPEELAAQADALHEVLEEFAAALEADNGEEGATLAAEVHTAQHEFSEAIDEWLGEGGGEHGHEE